MRDKQTPEEQKILDNWPVVTSRDISRMNDLFPHFLFFRPDKTGVSLWTSCCGQTGRIDFIRRTEFPKESALLDSLVHNRMRTCPYCGNPVTVKDLRKAGKRHSLCTCRCAVVLHARDDALYADAVDLMKSYETEADLTASPKYYLSSMYRFAAGDVMEVDYQDVSRGWITHERERLGCRKLVQEPFKRGCISYFSYAPYFIINREAIQDCPVTRYSQYLELWRPERESFFDFVSYLTAYCIYPRAIEMFVKSGFCGPVESLIYSRKKYAAAIKWEEPDFRKAMDISAAELRELIALKPPMDAMELRNRAKKWFGIQWTIPNAIAFYGAFLGSSHEVLRFCRTHKLHPGRLWAYLADHCVVDADLPWKDIMDVFQEYRDYLEAQYALGACMEHSKVLWPDNLHSAHDWAAAELDRRVKVSVRSGPVKGAARKEKYSFELDGLRVVFPLSAGSIKREGAALHHCVGGYAERHIKGLVTILFLRRVEESNKPYVTIEMDGNRIVQVHGYLNDRNGESPRVKHKDFFDIWLAWLKAGSKRDKDGNPVLPKKRKVLEVKSA